MRLLHLLGDLRRSRPARAPGIQEQWAKFDALLEISSANAWRKDTPWLGPREVGAKAIGVVAAWFVVAALLSAGSAGWVRDSLPMLFCVGVVCYLVVARLVMAKASWPLTPQVLLLERLRLYQPVDVEAYRILLAQAPSTDGPPHFGDVDKWVRVESEAVNRMPIWTAGAVREAAKAGQG